MKKIPCVFVRDFARYGCITRAVTPGCEWVLAGEGVPTRKWDGAACMVRDGRLYRRLDCKHGKIPPPTFEPCQDPDPVTGHWPGWIPVGDEPESRWFREGFAANLGVDCEVPDGTYELVGPKVGGNPERLPAHCLIRHGDDVLDDCPQPPTFDSLFEWMRGPGGDIEGVVWHHPDGRMAKLTLSAMGLVRGVR